MTYFSSFPAIAYEIEGKRFRTPSQYVAATDITAGVRILRGIVNNISVFEYYTVLDGETPEIVAEKLWGTQRWHWILLLLNDIYHPSDFVKPNIDMEIYIQRKYGTKLLNYTDGIEIARRRLACYRNDDKLFVLPNPFTVSGQTVTPSYELLEGNDYPTVKWTYDSGVIAPQPTDAYNVADMNAISAYDFELIRNEEKRSIKVVSQEVADVIATQFKAVMG